MYSPEVKNRIEGGIAGAKAYVSEFSGGTDHYAVTVVADAFEGLTLLKRHRMVMDLFRDEIKTGEVHALTLKLFTNAQFADEQR